MSFSFYDWAPGVLCYFAMFPFKKVVGVVCMHAFGYSVCNSLCCGKCHTFFIPFLNISSKCIVILFYNYFIWTFFVLNCYLTKVFCYKRILCLNNIFIFRWYMPGCIAEYVFELIFDIVPHVLQL